MGVWVGSALSPTVFHWSEAELQQPYRPWTWSSNCYVILQPFFTAAPWGPALERQRERQREKQPSDLQINFHWTLNISWKEPCSRRTDGLHVWPADPSESTQSCLNFYTWKKIEGWLWKPIIKLQTWESSGCFNVYTEMNISWNAEENAFNSQTKVVTVCNEWQEDFREKMLRRRAHTAKGRVKGIVSGSCFQSKRTCGRWKTAIASQPGPGSKHTQHV